VPDSSVQVQDIIQKINNPLNNYGKEKPAASAAGFILECLIRTRTA
jgi:hypothetical protein